MVAKIVADPDLNLVLFRQGLQAAELRQVERGRFFDENMFPSSHGLSGDRGQGGVRGGDDDNLDVRRGQGLGHLVGRPATGDRGRQLLGAAQGQIAGHRDRAGRQAGHALLADQAAADDGEFWMFVGLFRHSWIKLFPDPWE